ncbi:uncharacterized protein METZ01_LOCUS65892, partial [marine metagenome]
PRHRPRRRPRHPRGPGSLVNRHWYPASRPSGHRRTGGLPGWLRRRAMGGHGAGHHRGPPCAHSVTEGPV